MLPSVIGGPCGCFMGLVGPASDGRREFTGVLLALAESLQSGLISTRLMAPGRDYTGSHPAGHWGAVTLQGESRRHAGTATYYSHSHAIRTRVHEPRPQSVESRDTSGRRERTDPRLATPGTNSLIRLFLLGA
jgi:hypothetical protein